MEVYTDGTYFLEFDRLTAKTPNKCDMFLNLRMLSNPKLKLNGGEHINLLEDIEVANRKEAVSEYENYEPTEQEYLDKAGIPYEEIEDVNLESLKAEIIKDKVEAYVVTGRQSDINSYQALTAQIVDLFVNLAKRAGKLEGFEKQSF